MRHKVKGRKLNRTESHREALLNSLALSLLKHKRIRTTTAKAKETRTFVEGLLTKAKKNDLHVKRQIMSRIHDRDVVKELFAEIVPKIADRPGGYTRVVKLGNRKGDAAELSILELVDYNDIVNKKAEERKEKRESKRQSKKEARKAEQAEDAKIIEETSAGEKKK
jgi:large subunit ribosomal protein L17